ncbi:MAG: hypothetical protein WCU88_11580 [Elusimicrobiota bacterium]|jgi:hypothetical protein
MTKELFRRTHAWMRILGLAALSAAAGSIRVWAAPTMGTVTPSSTTTASHVSNPFNLNSLINEPTTATITGCESTLDGTTWNAASVVLSTCTATALGCTDGQSLTLNMRATNSNNETGTGSPVSRTCDAQAPTTTDNAPTDWQTQNVVVTLSPADNGSGLAQTKYCTDANNTCSPWMVGVSTTILSWPGALIQKYLRYQSIDNVGNTEAVVSKLIRIDRSSPTTTDNAPSTWQSNDVNVTLAPSDGSGSGVSQTLYCTDADNTCAPSTAGTFLSVACSTGTCQTYIRYYSVDNLGNTESVKSKLVRIDKVFPVTTDNAPSGWRRYDATVTLSSSDVGSSVYQTKYCTDGSDTCTPTTIGKTIYVTCASSSTCQTYVRYLSVDYAGNIETAHSKLVQIDKEAPTTTDNAPSAWQTGDVSATLSPTDGSGSGISQTKYCTDTNNTCTPWVVGVSTTVNCWPGGICQRYLRYQSFDVLGNTETVKSKLIQIDETAPVTTDDAPVSWQKSDVTVHLSSSDTGSGVYQTKHCTDESDTCTPSTVGTSVDVICAACQTHVRYLSIDNAGNTETAKSKLVKIDQEAPTTTDNAPSGWQAGDVSLTLSPSDGLGSGVAQTKFCLDADNTCTPWMVGISTSVVCPSGSVRERYLRYQSFDVVGNTETVKSKFIQVDKAFPGSSDDAPSGWQKQNVTVHFTSTDTGSGIYQTQYCTDANNTCTPSTAGTSVDLTCAACQTYVRYRGVDNAGNTETTKSKLVKIDQEAPTTTDNAPSGWQAANVPVTLTRTDGSGSGIYQTRYCTDDDGSCTPSVVGVSTTIACVNNSIKQRHLRYQSFDVVGNTETVKSKFIQIDKQAPSGGSISYANGRTTSPVSVSFTNGTDGDGSGIATRIIQRMQATYSGSSCGAYGAWTDVFTDPASSPASDAVSSGTCNKYRYRVTDNVGKLATYTSSSVAKIP